MQMNSLATLSVQQLRRALAIRERIDRLQKQLERLSGRQGSRPANVARPGKGKMSAAARAKISAGMKRRWAKRKGRKARK